MLFSRLNTLIEKVILHESKTCIVSYFRDFDAPLKEATRIQFSAILSCENETGWVFVKKKSKETMKSRSRLKVRGLVLLPIYIVLIGYVRLFLPKIIFYVYGPLDSRILRVLHKVCGGTWLLTDGGDVSHIAGRSCEKDSFGYIGYHKKRIAGYSANTLIRKPYLESHWRNMKVGAVRRLESNLLTDRRVIGYMSHFSEEKGIYDLFNSLLDLSPDQQGKLILKIANNKIKNDQGSEEKLNEFKKSFHGNVILYGTVNPKEFFMSIDLYVYPFKELRNTFNVPMTLLESILVGTPAVGPNFSTVSDWLPEQMLFNPGDNKSLREKIVMLLYSDETKLLCMKAKKNIENNVVFSDREFRC